MLEGDILKGGEQELLEFRELLQNLEQAEKDIKDAETKEKEKQKQLERKAKEIEKAISDNEAAERSLVAQPFDTEISELEGQKKSSLSAKGEKKREEIKRRGEEATLHLRTRNTETLERMKVLAEEETIPKLCRSKFFYSFYYPLAITDYLVLTMALLLWFAVLPIACGFLSAYFQLPVTMSDIYLVFVLIFFSVYILINNMIKEKHMDAYKRLNGMREDILQTNKEIRAILSLTKKTSETELGLEEFDSRVKELDKTMASRKGAKEEALQAFDKDKEAKAQRAELIRGQHQDSVDELTAELAALTGDREEKEARRNELQKKLESEYYKPLFAADRNIRKGKTLDDLFTYLRAGEATTIGEAIEKRKNPKAATKEEQ